MSDTTDTGSQTSETDSTEQETATPSIEDLTAELEALKGHSRKWEDRAKENFEARKELDALRAAQMTDAERAQATAAEVETRATAAEERAKTAEAELARYKIAVDFDLSKEDAEALASVTDEATLRALAERLSGRSSSGPRPNPAQGNRTKAAPATKAQAFADALDGLF